MSIEEAASMRKVKPAFKDESDGFEHVPGCLRYFFVFLAKLLFWTGLVPFKLNVSTKMFEFKLISISSLFAFVRLLIRVSQNNFFLNFVLFFEPLVRTSSLSPPKKFQSYRPINDRQRTI